MVLWGENSPYGGWCVLFVVAFFTLLFRVLAGLRKWRYRGQAVIEDNQDQEIKTDFLCCMLEKDCRIVIFYGTETDTAKGFAESLQGDLKLLGITSVVQDPMGQPMDRLGELVEVDKSIAVFILATYGEGEATENAEGLQSWLQSPLIEEPLTGVRYAVFGLGDSTYTQFNAFGRFVDKQLHLRGATRFYPYGEGDASKRIEREFTDWKDGFTRHALQHLTDK